MAQRARVRIARKVQATTFRSQYRRVAASARGNQLVLIENRRQTPKYLVEKEFLDALLRENSTARETLEILCDPELTTYLLKLGGGVAAAGHAGRLKTYSIEEVFGRL